jgi:hypothetical protein
MSDSVETLKFKVGLSATYFNSKPEYSVHLDSKEICRNTVSAESDEIFYIEFDAEIAENAEHKLIVKLHNKSKQDIVIEDDQIVKDTLLNIKSVEIDEIDLGSLIWTSSEYFPDHPQKFNGEIVSSLKNCVNLGWNGSYVLPFASPFYIWLLENI